MLSHAVQWEQPEACPAGLGDPAGVGGLPWTHEVPLPWAVCESGWRCCLINRDRKMPTDYIRNGVLYVTEK